MNSENNTLPADKSGSYEIGFAASGTPGAGYAGIAPKPKKEKFNLKTEDFVMAGVVFCLSLFGTVAGLWGGFRLGFSLAFDLGFISFLIFLGRERKRLSPYAAFTALLSLALSAVFVVTSNGMVCFCSLLTMTFGAVFSLTALSGAQEREGDLGLIRYVLNSLFLMLQHLPRSVSSLFQSGSAKMKSFSRVLIGVLIAVPVLLIVVPLLISSDFAFEGLVDTLFVNIGLKAVQLIVALLFTPFLLSFAFSLKYREKEEGKKSGFSGIDPLILTSFLGVLSFVYVLYLFSQLAYFFSAFQSILPEGYTTSQYARRGFFEMCSIAAVNFIVLFLAVIVSRKKEQNKLSLPLRILGTFISGFTLVLIGTALSKMVLYIRIYGMTVLRVGTSVFMAVLAVIFVAVILRLYIPKVNVLKTAFVSAAAALLALGLGNVNHVVAEYNFNFFSEREFSVSDVNFFSDLGPEGVSYLIRLTEYSDEKTSLYAKQTLRTKYEEFYEISDETYKIQSRRSPQLSQFSVPRQKAYQLLDAYLEENPNFLTEYQPYFYDYDDDRSMSEMD